MGAQQVLVPVIFVEGPGKKSGHIAPDGGTLKGVFKPEGAVLGVLELCHGNKYGNRAVMIGFFQRYIFQVMMEECGHIQVFAGSTAD